MIEDKPLFQEKRVPQQIVSVVPMLTSKILDYQDDFNSKRNVSKNNKENNKNDQNEIKICGLCHSQVVSPGYYKVDENYLHEYCYQAISGPFCHCCSQPLAGKECIQALGKIYHKECLRCSICQKQIERNDKIDSYKGLPVCHQCFGKKGKECPSCNQIVLRGGLRFLFEGKMIHVHRDCALCHECGKKVTQEDFAYEQGEILCKECWFSLANFVCIECGEVILPSERISYNGFRHAKCFKCHNCGVNLIKSDPKYIGDMLLCKRCFSGIKTHCCMCMEQVTSNEKVERFGRVFHPKCYRCTCCKKPLHNIEAQFKRGKVLCIDCLSADK